MEQRCEIILQNYLKTLVYNNDYKIINENSNIVIYYKNIMLLFLF